MVFPSDPYDASGESDNDGAQVVGKAASKHKATTKRRQQKDRKGKQPDEYQSGCSVAYWPTSSKRSPRDEVPKPRIAAQAVSMTTFYLREQSYDYKGSWQDVFNAAWTVR